MNRKRRLTSGKKQSTADDVIDVNIGLLANVIKAVVERKEHRYSFNESQR